LTAWGNLNRWKGRAVSVDFFSVLGVQPVLGRGFLEEEDQSGNGKVVVISYDFWETHFAGSKDVLGRQIKLDDKSYEVVGVAPAKFDFPFQAKLWLPMAWTEKERR